MSALTLHLDEVRAGDAITHVDGEALPRPLDVLVPLSPIGVARTPGVRVANPASALDWVIYPGNVTDNVTVDRAERKPRRVTRRVNGLTLTSTGDSEWVTADGRYRVFLNPDYPSECEHPHPMRVTTTDAEHARKHPHDFLSVYGYAVYQAVERCGFRPVYYQCPGDSIHTYSRWVLWDNTISNYLKGEGPGGYDTFSEAARALASALHTEGR